MNRRNKLQCNKSQIHKHKKNSRKNDSLSSKEIQLLDAESNKKFQ